MRVQPFDIHPYGVIGVAVSGGMDSMCLLHYLHALGAPLLALTVEHGIRGDASVEDAMAVEDYCRTLGVPLEVRHVDVPLYARTNGMGLEQAARTLRHAFFAEMLDKGVVDTIATAHHLDDRCEGLLLNLLRGSGIRGLGGVGHRPHYVCPFLGWTRQNIRQYADQNGVPYRHDATNDDLTMNRNYLRHEILPRLEERYPQYRQSMARLADACREQADLMDTLAIRPIVEGEVVYLPLAAFAQHPALVKWSIGLAAQHFDHGVDFDAEAYRSVLALADGDNNATICLSHGLQVAREYDRVAFWSKGRVDHVVYPFGEGYYDFGGVTYLVRPYREGDTLRFDPDKVPQGAVVRLRREGDQIAKFGGGTKSLGDYYTDKKVPLRVRDSHPVVAWQQQILVCCADISRTVAVDANTQRIYTFVQEDKR